MAAVKARQGGGVNSSTSEMKWVKKTQQPDRVIDRYTRAPPITEAEKEELLTAICSLYSKENKGRLSAIAHRFFLICGQANRMPALAGEFSGRSNDGLC
jgi:hypothetical protein